MLDAFLKCEITGGYSQNADQADGLDSFQRGAQAGDGPRLAEHGDHLVIPG